MRGWILTACVVAACGDNLPPTHEVMAVPAQTTSKLDLLFVISNEGNTIDFQRIWAEAFPSLLAEISVDGRPDLHIAVISPDLGTQVASGAMGPTIPGSVGGCSYDGDGGALIQRNTNLPYRFLIDSVEGSNHPGALAEDLRQMIATLGAAGCSYQQHLAAVRAAFANPSNAGFRRDDAALGIVVVSDEDDCSALDPDLFDADTSTLGPRQHFRCTQFGVRCAEPDMTTPGPRTSCIPDSTSTVIEDPASFLPVIRALDVDPRRVAFGAVISSGEVAIELRSSSSNGLLTPALVHTCDIVDEGILDDVVDPAVRLRWFAEQLGDRGTTAPACNDGDLGEAATSIGIGLRRAMGDSCVEDDLDLARCLVVDQLGTTETALPPCAGGTSSCYDVVTDEVACPHAAHAKLVVHHDAAPGTYTLVRC